jgi:flagellar biosynthesis/type III secretory pathway protein FliH
MSIAEKLRQEGREEGWQEGRVKGLQEGAYRGQIQLCQRILGVPLMSTQDLDQLSAAEQQELLNELQARLQQRLREQ